MSKIVYIEKDDVMIYDHKDFFGLTYKQNMRLKYGPVIKLKEVKQNSEGDIIEAFCEICEDSK